MDPYRTWARIEDPDGGDAGKCERREESEESGENKRRSNRAKINVRNRTRHEPLPGKAGDVRDRRIGA